MRSEGRGRRAGRQPTAARTARGDILQEMGCELGQGVLVSPPVPAEVLPALASRAAIQRQPRPGQPTAVTSRTASPVLPDG